uniref:Protein kinase domain-containing protein n=1 Tax=Setaria digitata TaxID=48799 RepID=A0A915Q462_9BILA
MTIGTSSTGSRNSSRSTRNAKYSTSKVRSNQYGSGITGGNSTTGDQPLCGLPGGSKSEIKHRFEITKKLGSGTYGKVSLAYDHKTEREVAVKLIKKSAIENKQDLVRIRREIRIMSALKHPNIIQIFEVFENRDKIILVMEYASGGELYDYVSTFGSLPEPEARRIFRQITSAILYCHKHKVAHRDLKLENILLDADNNAKIADFGLSNYFSDKTLLNTFCGSPLYASPEIINGTPYRGPEVDCWSLGILLYTLVYGSMPFDGRDFNRMVRQIRRGAYFEPDTPSTASMLIRNMLRVNPERRADIDEIASHWWLNLDENMPVIQELPENQIIDHTPLTDRAETMVVQDLADESDVFMDFGHLSPSTRLKIEEFRRRRKEAEEYVENSPIKPPKARKTDGTELPTLTAAEKSLRYDPRLNKEKKQEGTSVEEPDSYYEPLERLKRLESRLQGKDNQASVNKENRRFKQPSMGNVSGSNNSTSRMKIKNERLSPEQPDDPVTSNSKISEISTAKSIEMAKPSFVSLDSESSNTAAKSPKKQSVETWKLETDLLNMLMNQVLEQMEKGPVSMTLVARIKAHPLYDSRPMVKELLESIIAAQPPSVQKQASKLIQQQSQELIKRQTAGTAGAAIAAAVAVGGAAVGITGRRNSKAYEMIAPGSPVKGDDKRKYQPIGTNQRNGQAKNFGERPWHSVEVGFDPDEDVEHTGGTPKTFSHNDELTEETVPETSFEDATDEEIVLEGVIKQSKAKSEGHEEVDELKESEECDDEDDEEVEESDSEIDELGKEVEQIEDEENGSYRTAVSEENLGDSGENNPPPDPHMKTIPPQFVDAFDRGLAKRQSKGKYQHSKVELYGRGVSTECESPTLPHRRIGGPQPPIERSLFLFDKAKKYIMTYPKPIDDSADDIPGRLGKKVVKNWLRTQDPDVIISGSEGAAADISSRVCSVPPRSPPNVMKSEDEASESESDEDEDDDEDEDESGESDFESSEQSETNKITSQKPAEIEKQQAKSVELEPNAMKDDIKYQIKSKGKEECSKKDVSLTRKLSKPTKLSNRLLAVPSHDTFVHCHNWDRRRRNRTIDVSENILKSIVDHRDEVTPGRFAGGHAFATINDSTGSSWTRTSGTPNRPISPGLALADHTLFQIDPFYAHNKFLKEANDRDFGYSGYPNSTVHGQNSRYIDDFRRTVDKDAVSPTRLNLGANHNLYLSRDDKRKSKSAHDLSPDRPDLYPGTTNANKLAPPGSSNINRYDNESSIPQSWALEPKRFYVYQTRAEREAEKNTAVSNLHPSSTYRTTGSSWYTGTSTGNHPISTYASDYKSRYDDNYPYRRNTTYDADTSIVSHRYRPSGRHVPSVLGDPTRRIYGRSNSMERNALRSEDGDYFGYRNFLTTAELNSGDKGEYSYVNFHDTSARGSTPHEPDHSKIPTRGILKNKQNTETDSRTSAELSSTGSGQGIVGGKDQASATSGVKHMFDRLKRHLSAEKSTSPGPNSISSPGLTYRNHFPSTKNLSIGETADHASSVRTFDESKVSKEESSKAAKKRSLFLALGRRRTTEMRLGPDGKITIGGLESEFKRPSSPIDKIKSLFRKSKESVSISPVSQPMSSNYAHLDYVNFPSSASGRYSLVDKVYGVYPSSHLTPAITREPFSPQYRKYTAAVTTPGSATTNYNRYSYTPGANDRMLRHWHEDPHIY